MVAPSDSRADGEGREIIRSAPGSGIPDVPRAPAPWQLTGDAYILLLRMPKEMLQKGSFIPGSLRGREVGRYGITMFVDYTDSNVGPYQELLCIPCRFRFGRKVCGSITRIFVSSWESVVNGRLNWGIPKDRADFKRTADESGSEVVTVSRDGRVFAEMRFKSYGFALPVHSGVLPQALRTVGQHYNGKTYLYTLNTRGRAAMARLLDCKVDPQVFPDISRCRVLTAVRLRNFSINFPTAKILPHQQ